MKYFITYHAVERLKERFPVFYSKQSELKDWTKDKGTGCVKMLFDKLVENSEENRSYLNNSVYMLKLYDKYGFDAEYCFLEHKEENILFIFTKNRSENHYRLVTLMPTEFRPLVKNIKYNTKQTKEAKHTKFVMDLYDKLESKNSNLVNKVVTPVILECSPETKEKLFELIKNNKTQIITRISNTKTMHKAMVEDVEYEFTYSKTNSGVKEIHLEKITGISEEDKRNKKLQSYVTPELKKSLISLVHQNLTSSEKISNSKSLHTAQLNGMDYHFLCQKTSSGDRNIFLQKEPISTQINKKNRI